MADSIDLSGGMVSKTGLVNTSGLTSTNTQPIDLASVPEYERQVASSASLERGSMSDNVAHVAGPIDGPSGGPNHISVDDPSSFTPSTQAHELQHVIQNRNTSAWQDLQNVYNPRQVSLAQTKPTPNNGGTDESAYDYGGTAGLAKHLASGKTVADLTSEQQASIPQNYMDEYRKAVKAGDAKGVDRLNRVYQPAIQQLRNMANPSRTAINTTPAAPGPPPSALTGLATALPGMYSNQTSMASLPIPRR